MMVMSITPSEEKFPSCCMKEAGAVQVGKGFTFSWSALMLKLWQCASSAGRLP